jgi:diamine N-acetyltransferase
MSEAPQPIINFSSERLAFGPMTPEYRVQALQWINDFAVSAPRAMSIRPYTSDHMATWAERNRANNDILFVIYEQPTFRPIGETGFTAVNMTHQTAEFGIMIGETSCWGQGYGTEATQRLLAYGFDLLGLHLIWLRVSSSNHRGMRVYHRAGFREAGRLHEALRIGRTRDDEIYMECLATDFLARVQQRDPHAENAK